MDNYNVVDPSKLEDVTATNVHNTYRFPKKHWQFSDKHQCLINAEKKQRTGTFFRVVGEEDDAYLVLYKIWTA